MDILTPLISLFSINSSLVALIPTKLPFVDVAILNLMMPVPDDKDELLMKSLGLIVFPMEHLLVEQEKTPSRVVVPEVDKPPERVLRAVTFSIPPRDVVPPIDVTPKALSVSLTIFPHTRTFPLVDRANAGVRVIVHRLDLY